MPPVSTPTRCSAPILHPNLQIPVNAPLHLFHMLIGPIWLTATAGERVLLKATVCGQATCCSDYLWGAERVCLISFFRKSVCVTVLKATGFPGTRGFTRRAMGAGRSIPCICSSFCGCWQQHTRGRQPTRLQPPRVFSRLARDTESSPHREAGGGWVTEAWRGRCTPVPPRVFASCAQVPPAHEEKKV